MAIEYYVATLEERLLDLMFDGEEWTAKRLALSLGVRALRVRIALRALTKNSEVHVVRIGAGRGKARIFRYGAAPSALDLPKSRRSHKLQKAARRGGRWPELDPLLAQAFHAMALTG